MNDGFSDYYNLIKKPAITEEGSRKRKIDPLGPIGKLNLAFVNMLLSRDYQKKINHQYSNQNEKNAYLN